MEASLTMHFLTLLHYFILLVNSYVLLRVLRTTPVAAIAGATLVAFGANMESYFLYLTVLAPYSWCPLFVASLVLAFDGIYRKSAFFLCVLSLTLIILAAPSLPFIHCALIGGVLSSICLFTAAYRRDFDRIKSFLTTILPAGFVTFLITSPYLISELVSLPNFIRWVESGPVIGKTKIPFESFLLDQLPPSSLGGVLVPSTKVLIVGNPFFGFAACVLTFLSVHVIRRHPLIIGLWVLGLWGLLSAFGSHFGLAYINYHIPFVNLMREPSRHLFVFAFCGSILSGLGLDYLLRNISESPAFFLKRYNIACILFLTLAVVLLEIERRTGIAYLWTCLGAVALLCLFAITKATPIRIVLVSLFIPLVIVSNLWPYPFPKVPIASGDYFWEWNLRSHRVLNELSKIADIRSYRVIFSESKNSYRWSMNASYYDIRSFNAFLNPLPYEQFVQIYYHGSSPANYRELLGAKYLLCGECSSTTLGNYRLRDEIEGYKLYETDKALPRYRVVHQVGGAYSTSAEFHEKLAAKNDYLSSVLVKQENLERLGKHVSPNTPQEQSCTIREELSSTNRLHLSVDCHSPGLLILNEYYLPNWLVSINGRKEEIFQVNLNQLAVLLNKGTSAVEFSYEPALFYRLLLLSRATLLFLVLSLAVIAISRVTGLPRRRSGDNVRHKT
jgi:hypothetical protein